MSNQSGANGDGGSGGAVWPSFEQLEELLNHWAGEHSETMGLQVAGTSAGGRPVYAVRLTDPAGENADNEHVLLTALHAGQERTGATTVFAIMEWLLSGSPSAREILRRQIVVCMPIPHPDGYVGGGAGPVYSGWTLDGPLDPKNTPEAVAVQTVMDELQPEVHADIHGLNMAFDRYIMLENSGSSYSNLALRSYHREIIRMMDQAALAEGYPSDWQESDSERIFWGPALEPMASKLWVGRPRVYAATYCYNLYHTLLSASEVCWERSGLLRHRRLFDVGNQRWPGEYYPGYPTRVIASNNYHHLAAYGTTAAARRRSRVELWQNVGRFTHGMADPNIEGKLVYVCATNPAAAEKWLRPPTLEGFAANLANHPGMNHAEICDVLRNWPAGQNHPEAWLALHKGNGSADATTPIRHGLVIRLRLFYDKATITDLRLNGHPVPKSETDGYAAWAERGMTFIRVNIPPERLKTDDLFVVTCRYAPNERRPRWRGWE